MTSNVFAALALGLLFAADAAQDAAKKELEQLAGTWTISALEVEGQKVADEKLQGTTLVIKDNKYIVTARGQSHETVITLDPGKKPKSIDMVFSQGMNKDKVHRGIYELDGDTLKLCRSQQPEADRPEAFTTSPRAIAH